MCVDSDEDAGSSDAVEVQPGSIEYSCWLLTIDFHLLLTYLLSVVSFLYCFSSSVYSVAQEQVATVVTWRIDTFVSDQSNKKSLLNISTAH